MKCEGCGTLHSDGVVGTLKFPYHTTRKHTCTVCGLVTESLAVNSGDQVLVDMLWSFRRVIADRDLFQMQTIEAEAKVAELQLRITLLKVKNVEIQQQNAEAERKLAELIHRLGRSKSLEEIVTD